MKLRFGDLDRSGRDTVSGLILGYEADALQGIKKIEQIERACLWRRRGWSKMMYHYHILAIFIGYAQARRKSRTIELPGMGGY
ncbi:MAG: hypothetical protein H0W28_07505 [Pyrinomonadaceae bacterium]|nr:hypothetical protein [Pyrinomonadaceae bacterium]